MIVIIILFYKNFNMQENSQHVNKFKKLISELETKLITGIKTQICNFCIEFESKFLNSKVIDKS